MTETKEKKGINKFILCAFIVIVIAVAAVVVYMMNAPKEIDVNDYVTVEFSGYETMGEAKVTFDSEEFFYDFSQVVKLSDKIQKEYDMSGLGDMYDFFKNGAFGAMDLQTRMEYELSASTDLSNGDDVTLSWAIDVDYVQKHYGVKLLCDSQTLNVTGLEEVKPFNPFDDLDISFEGTNGAGTVVLEVNSEDEIYEGITFRADKTSGLSNGDEIVITYGANFGKDLESYCAQNYGKVPDTVEMEVTVEGLK